MQIKTAISEFHDFLLFEKGQAKNTVEAYLRDVHAFELWLKNHLPSNTIEEITKAHIDAYVVDLGTLPIETSTQARMIAGMKAFFSFLLFQDIIDANPSSLIDAPKRKQKLPAVLSHAEILDLIQAIDLSTTFGHRNRAMIEVLYACGLRVSELTTLKISQLFFDAGFIRVIGKRDKERLVPIGTQAIAQVNHYLNGARKQVKVKPGFSDYLFLTKSGKALSRVMIFLLVKELVQKAGIQKNVSPHTFRHSFATHLVEGGADLRAIQQMLGHESITTTELYTHLDQSYLRETILQFHPANQPTN